MLSSGGRSSAARASVEPEHLLLGNTPRQGSESGIGDPVPLEKIEELHIRGVLASSASIEQAAQILGMDTVTLWRRRKKYEI